MPKLVADVEKTPDITTVTIGRSFVTSERTERWKEDRFAAFVNF